MADITNSKLCNMIGKKKTTHIRIMHIAKTLFEKNGLEGVTVDDISSGAEICRSTFFNHFSSINELLKEIATQEIDDLLEVSAKYKNNSLLMIQKVMEKLVDDTTPYPYLTIKLLMSQIMSNEENNPLSIIERIIMDGLVNIGVSEDYSPLEAVALVFGSYYGVIFQLFINRRPFDNTSGIKATIYKAITTVIKS